MAGYCAALLLNCRTDTISDFLASRLTIKLYTTAFSSLEDKVCCNATVLLHSDRKNGAIVKDLDRYEKAPRKENVL